MSQIGIEKFDISQILPVISCDYESLKNWALDYIAKYRDLLVTEDQVKDIKKDMAEINKAKQNLERARIDAVKAVSAPIKAFETKIKEVVGIFDEAYKSLGDQVKEYEAAAREAKRAEIQATIDRQIADFIGKHQDMEGKIAILIPDKWLNKTCHMKDIGNEIDRLIREQYAEDQDRQRKEKAQAERRLLIENAVKAANEKYGADLPVSKFMEPQFTSLDLAADGVLKRIEEIVQLNVDMGKKEAVNKKILEAVKCQGWIESANSFFVPENQETVAAVVEPQLCQPEPVQNDRIMIRFTATFTPEQESQVREILNQNQFMRIKRQLDSIGVKTTYEKVANEVENEQN